MARTKDFVRYVEACKYPGRLDVVVVEQSLKAYLNAIGAQRTVRRLPIGWDLATEEPLRRSVLMVLDDFAKRTGRDARAASAASDARDALAARAALAARDASAARDALATLDASDASDASDARAALDARADLDALDASDAIAALAARDALVTRDARAALDARDALDARAARAALDARDALDALDALDARAALDARDALDASIGALRRFALWCIQRGWWWWGWDLSWTASALLGAQQIKRELPWMRPFFEAYIAGCWMLYWTQDTLYWIAKPTVKIEIVNGNRRLHCVDGPAIEADSENLYFWHGVLVPAFVIVRPDCITVEHISTEENAEVRRVMLERFGEGRYLKEIGAKPIHEDDYGTLYRVELAGDEPLVMVRVLNSTPEHDGSVKPYFLRTDPTLRPLLADGQFGEPQEMTAKNAIASTFGMYGKDYSPGIQT